MYSNKIGIKQAAMFRIYKYDIDESSVFGQRRVTITPTYTAMTEDLAGKPGRLHSFNSVSFVYDEYAQ
ncbi:hypothetical protein DERF_001945 [Dermatophagoides farinae]|uniref:Uncharacterized protein n=1 Tax=Dermatophagoides farinae TaxID=6954 RepID=A0A922LA54_DERFA|nr:hypothetical protein DERF_001945 [Dermatophagoides farinae]